MYYRVVNHGRSGSTTDMALTVSPEWHGDVLAARKEKMEKGEATFISLDKLKQYYVAKD